MKNTKRKKSETPAAVAGAAPCSAIVVDNETCLIHSDIDRQTNKGTAALDGWASDADGNEWELSAYVTVKWKRLATGFGKCDCGGNMVAKAPNHPKARVRCDKCATEMFLSNWLRKSPNAPHEPRRE